MKIKVFIFQHKDSNGIKIGDEKGCEALQKLGVSQVIGWRGRFDYCMMNKNFHVPKDLLFQLENSLRRVGSMIVRYGKAPIDEFRYQTA